MLPYSEYSSIRIYPPLHQPDVEPEPTETEMKETLVELRHLLYESWDFQGSNAAFNDKIHGMADSIRAHIWEMMKQGNSRREIYGYAKDSINQLQSEKRAFDDSKISTGEKAEAFNRQCNMVKEKLNPSNPQFAPLFPSSPPQSEHLPTPKELMAADPFWAHKQQNNLERIYFARGAAAVVSCVEHGFSAWFQEIGDNFHREAHYICNKNPVIRERCDQIIEFGTLAGNYMAEAGKYVAEEGKELFKSVPYSKDITKTYNSFSSHIARANAFAGDALANELERQYLIPKEDGKAYTKDVNVLLPYATLALTIPPTTGLLGRAVVAPFTALSRIGQGTKAAESIPFTTMAKIERGSKASQVVNAHVRDIYRTVEDHPYRGFSWGIGEVDAIRRIEKLFPSLDHLATNDVGIWTKAIEMNRLAPISNPTVRYYTEDRKDRIVAKITDGVSSFIVKEDFVNPDMIVNELIGNHFFRNSLNLKNMRLPETVAIGSRDNGKKYFIVKDYLSGKTFEKLIEEVGCTQIQSAERNKLLDGLSDAAFHAGRALGELQNKGLSHSQSSIALEAGAKLAVGELDDKINSVSHMLNKISLPHTFNAERFKPAVETFLRDPGPLSYGFNDISGGQFIWNPLHKRPFGYIDAEFATSSFSKAGKPLLLAHEEYHKFLRVFESEGLVSGMLPSETSLLKEFFSRGYAADYKGLRSAPADRFFDLSSSIDTIEALVGELLLNRNSSEIRPLLQRQLRELDKKF